MGTLVKNLHEKFNKMNDKDYIEKFLVYNLSIVITGNKPSATVTLKKGNDSNYEKWSMYGIDFLNSIGLKYIVLREEKEAEIVLIYNEDLLKSYVFIDDNYKFLISLGYSYNKCISSYLEKLKERYAIFKCPHELGIFLGFPINDVKDFMKCTTKKCLMCGYWKVYNNLEDAIVVFDKFDSIKKQTAQNILYGLKSRDLVYKLKS